MAGEATARVLSGDGVETLAPASAFGGGPPPSPPEPAISNARLGLMMFIGAEVMFFAGLIGAFLVLRLSSEVWPPPSQPRLPVWITGFNTLVLLCSGVAMHWASLAARLRDQVRLCVWLPAAAVLGALFLCIQGYEWVRLIGFGLTMQSGLYRLHLLRPHRIARAPRTGSPGVGGRGVDPGAARTLCLGEPRRGVELCTMYWTFVVALWPVLYGLVYLY